MSAAMISLRFPRNLIVTIKTDTRNFSEQDPLRYSCRMNIGVCKDYLIEIQIDYLNLFHSSRLEE